VSRGKATSRRCPPDFDRMKSMETERGTRYNYVLSGGIA